MLKAAEFFVGGQQLVRLNEKVIGEVSRDHGINATEMSILLFLAGNPDLNTAKDIVESRLMTKSSVSRAVDSLVDGTFSHGVTGMFRELYDALLKVASCHQPDHYFLLKDFDSYQETRLRANREYQNPELFYRKCYLNMANAGKFSSDRTIRQYYEEIWSNR